MKTIQTDGVRPLVQYAENLRPQAKPVFITISPPAKCSIVCLLRGKDVKRQYQVLPHALQLDFCIKLFKSIYLQYMPESQYIIVTELNKSGLVHLHILLYDDDVKTDYDLHMIRHHVKIHSDTIKYCKNIKLVPHFHHIFYPDDAYERADYMSKDLKQSSKYFPVYVSDELTLDTPSDSESDDTYIE